MRTLGCDLGNPGALVVLKEIDGDMPQPVFWREWTKLDLHQLYTLVTAVLDEQGPIDVAATERPFTGAGDRRPGVGMAQRGKHDLVKAACECAGVCFLNFPPQTIKKAATGNGRASKAQVAAIIGRLTGLRGSDHLTDAAAIAMTAMARGGK